MIVVNYLSAKFGTNLNYLHYFGKAIKILCGLEGASSRNL